MLKKTVFLALIMVSHFINAEEIHFSETEVLHFDKGQSFQYEIARDPDDRFEPSLKFSHFGEDGFVDFTFKVFSRKTSSDGAVGSTEVKNAVTKTCESHVDGSVEKVSTIRPLAGIETGHYCTFTDASIPEDMPVMPGMFKKLTLASFETGNYIFMVNAFSNTSEDPLFSEFLSVLRSFKITTKPATPLTTQSR